MSSKQKNQRSKQLAQQTIQIIGFGFAIFLTGYKLYSSESDIPWYVIFGFFGFGASTDFKWIANIWSSK